MSLDCAWLQSHIPHHGDMCLLAQVDEWDEQHIRCRANSHRRVDNPLRINGVLGIVCGIEYAAQAMAAHGALLAATDQPPRNGYLTSVRSVELYVARLDDIIADLSIDAERLSGDNNNILYGFSITADGHVVLSGRAAVVLDADKFGKNI